MSDEIASAIKRDRAEHPQCNYSQSSSTQCSMQNNELVCDTVRRVMRMCQGERPVEIFRKTETSTDDSSDHAAVFPHFSQPPSFFSSSPHDDMLGDPFKMMDKMMKGVFGGGFSGFFGDDFGHFAHPDPHLNKLPHSHSESFPHHDNMPPPHMFPKGQYPKKPTPLTGTIIGKEESV